MGSTKIQTESNTTSTPTPTAQETEMNKAMLEQFKQYEPGQTTMFKNAFAMGNQLLTSFGDKSGEQWKSLIGGVTPEQQQRMIAEQQRYLNPQFQQNGIYDSGLAYTASLRSATDLANQNAQFNVGTLQNALNLALSGQAQIQQPALGQASNLSNQLAGLRTTQTSGVGVQRNPFNGFNLGIFGNWGGSNYSCWVASEIFGGWYEPKTCLARYYISEIAPTWFKKFYLKYGERIAKFIHNKPIFKLALKPLFEYFVYRTNKLLTLSY